MVFDKYFQKNGLEKKDIPVALIGFKAISWTMWIGTFAICYKAKPLQRLIKTPFMQQKIMTLKTNYPNFHARCHNFVINTTKKVSESKYFRKIPKTLGLKSITFSEALAENIIFYKLCLPVFLPAQLWLTLYTVKSYKKKKLLDTKDIETVTIEEITE